MVKFLTGARDNSRMVMVGHWTQASWFDSPVPVGPTISWLCLTASPCVGCLFKQLARPWGVSLGTLTYCTPLELKNSTLTHFA
jgi:hypothetical protein